MANRKLLKALESNLIQEIQEQQDQLSMDIEDLAMQRIEQIRKKLDELRGRVDYIRQIFEEDNSEQLF